jgi:hypothetical protein
MRYFVMVFDDYVLILASDFGDKVRQCGRFEVRAGQEFRGYSYAQLREHGDGELEA